MVYVVMCISLVYVNGLWFMCVSSTQKFISSTTVLQVYVCNSSERQGIHEVGMYECEWQGVNIYYSRAHMKSSLCNCKKNHLKYLKYWSLCDV